MLSDNALHFPPPGYAAKATPNLWDWLSIARNNPLSGYPRDCYARPHMTWRFARNNLVFVFEPALLEEIFVKQVAKFPKAPLQNRFLKPMFGNSLVTTEGVEWRRQRKIAAPLFRPKEMVSYVSGMAKGVEESCSVWPTEQPFDIAPYCKQLTLNILQNTLFSETKNVDSKAFLTSTQATIDGYGQPSVLDLLGLPPQMHPRRWQARSHIRSLRAFIQDLINDRRASKWNGSDLLGRFLSAQDEETGEMLSDENVIDNIITLFGAGFETTANTLSWALYVLAKNSDLQDMLYAEQNVATIGDTVLDTFPLAFRCIKETLRLFPPTPLLVRSPSEEVLLDDLVIPEGSTVFTVFYITHRHESHWENPNYFDLDRFGPLAESKRHRMAFLPFGAGPRTCIGMQFAYQEAVLALSKLVGAFEFSEAPGNDPIPWPTITLNAKGGIHLIAKRRE